MLSATAAIREPDLSIGFHANGYAHRDAHMSLPPLDEDIVVFQGSHRACQEFSLVLEAQSIPYQLIEQDLHWVLAVPPPLQAMAREELARYTLERRRPHRFMPPPEPFPGSALGAIAYVIVLLTTAHAAGAGWFGVDWMDAGDLQRNPAGQWPWWRALTALTLHLDAVHLIGNLLFGVAAGVIVGRMFGPGVAWAAIILSAATANLLELLMAPVGYRAVGASTAVFAALGMLSGYGWGQQRKLAARWLHRWAPLLAGASLLALFGAGSEQVTEKVDVLGHLLGFICGVGMGYLFARNDWPRSRSAGLQWIAGAFVFCALLIAWFRALWMAPGVP